MNVLCFGDSNTFGYIPGGRGRYEKNIRYPGALQRLLGAEYTIYEDGLCGRTTVFDEEKRPGRRGVDDIRSSVRRVQPDLLVLMLGTNDCKTQFGADAEEIARGMLRIARCAQEERPELRIVLCAPVRIGREALTCADDYCEHSLDVCGQLPAAYRRAAARHGFAFLDANQAASSDPADGEHLNARGHLAFARAARDAITALCS